MAIISRTNYYGEYYTSPLNSSDPLDLERMKVNATNFYKWMSSSGVTTNAIAGMLGNFQVESTINPGRWQNDDAGNESLGYGLAQWTPATKYFNYVYDDEPFTMENNISMLFEIEIQDKVQWIATSDYPETYQQFLQSTKSPTYLAKAFLYNYERAGVEKVDLRVEYANYWYEYLTGEEPPLEPDNPTPTPSTTKKKKGYNFVLFNKRRRIYG